LNDYIYCIASLYCSSLGCKHEGLMLWFKTII
jgi:hypothetical protein